MKLEKSSPVAVAIRESDLILSPNGSCVAKLVLDVVVLRTHKTFKNKGEGDT